MGNIVFLSSSLDDVRSWYEVLKRQYKTKLVSDCIKFDRYEIDNGKPDLLIIDAQVSIFNDVDLSALRVQSGKILVIGDSFPEDKQITVILEGSSGYVDKSLSSELIPRVIESVLKGEIWLGRQLIPKMIASLVAKNHDKVQFDQNNLRVLSELTERERQVVRYINCGETNHKIAEQMNISNRTVKAHLASIYRKLDVEDRFQLVVKLKDAYIAVLNTSV